MEFSNPLKELLRIGLSVLFFTQRLFTFSTDRMRQYGFYEVLEFGLHKSSWVLFIVLMGSVVRTWLVHFANVEKNIQQEILIISKSW